MEHFQKTFFLGSKLPSLMYGTRSYRLSCTGRGRTVSRVRGEVLPSRGADVVPSPRSPVTRTHKVVVEGDVPGSRCQPNSGVLGNVYVHDRLTGVPFPVGLFPHPSGKWSCLTFTTRSTVPGTDYPESHSSQRTVTPGRQWPVDCCFEGRSPERGYSELFSRLTPVDDCVDGTDDLCTTLLLSLRRKAGVDQEDIPRVLTLEDCSPRKTHSFSYTLHRRTNFDKYQTT